MPGRLGGYPANARPAGAVPGSVVKPTQLAPKGAVVKNGGVPYVGDDRHCPVPKKGGDPCKANPTATGLCAGHQRQANAHAK